MFVKEISLLNKLGLTDSEAKVYLALLRNGSASGYEASKISAVPRSKIYNILESLTIKGYIIYAEEENNNRYAAVPIDEIEKKVKYETDNILEELTSSLKDFPVNTDLDYLWHIRQNTNVFAKCKEILQRTEKELLLQIWEEDLPKLLPEIKALEDKNIRMGIVYFSNDDKSDVPLKKYCRHGLVEEKLMEMGGRWITLVSDMKEVVFGQIISESTVEVIWTESRPLIVLAAECVRHDMYFYKNAGIFKEAMQRELGDDFFKVRDIF